MKISYFNPILEIDTKNWYPPPQFIKSYGYNLKEW